MKARGRVAGLGVPCHVLCERKGEEVERTFISPKFMMICGLYLGLVIDYKKSSEVKQWGSEVS